MAKTRRSVVANKSNTNEERIVDQKNEEQEKTATLDSETNPDVKIKNKKTPVKKRTTRNTRAKKIEETDENIQQEEESNEMVELLEIVEENVDDNSLIASLENKEMLMVVEDPEEKVEMTETPDFVTEECVVEETVYDSTEIVNEVALFTDPVSLDPIPVVVDENIGIRKSKRHHKITKKLDDFIVDTSLKQVFGEASTSAYTPPKNEEFIVCDDSSSSTTFSSFDLDSNFEFKMKKPLKVYGGAKLRKSMPASISDGNEHKQDNKRRSLRITKTDGAEEIKNDEEPGKRKRGRPKKSETMIEDKAEESNSSMSEVIEAAEVVQEAPVAIKRGRPKKSDLAKNVSMSSDNKVPEQSDIEVSENINEEIEAVQKVSKRGRPKKSLTLETSTASVEEQLAEMEDHNEPSAIVVVDDASNNSNIDIEMLISKETKIEMPNKVEQIKQVREKATIEKKKGRGRPPKSAKVETKDEASEVQANDESDEKQAKSEKEVKHETKLESLKVNFENEADAKDVKKDENEALSKNKEISLEKLKAIGSDIVQEDVEMTEIPEEEEKSQEVKGEVSKSEGMEVDNKDETKKKLSKNKESNKKKSFEATNSKDEKAKNLEPNKLKKTKLDSKSSKTLVNDSKTSNKSEDKQKTNPLDDSLAKSLESVEEKEKSKKVEDKSFKKSEESKTAKNLDEKSKIDENATPKIEEKSKSSEEKTKKIDEQKFSKISEVKPSKPSEDKIKKNEIKEPKTPKNGDKKIDDTKTPKNSDDKIKNTGKSNSKSEDKAKKSEDAKSKNGDGKATPKPEEKVKKSDVTKTQKLVEEKSKTDDKSIQKTEEKTKKLTDELKKPKSNDEKTKNDGKSTPKPDEKAKKLTEELKTSKNSDGKMTPKTDEKAKKLDKTSEKLKQKEIKTPKPENEKPKEKPSKSTPKESKKSKAEQRDAEIRSLFTPKPMKIVEISSSLIEKIKAEEKLPQKPREPIKRPPPMASVEKKETEKPKPIEEKKKIQKVVNLEIPVNEILGIGTPLKPNDPEKQIQDVKEEKVDESEIDSCTKILDEVKISEPVQDAPVEDFGKISLEENDSLMDENSQSSQETNKEENIEENAVRRSSRIKTISSQKQRSVGHGLVKDKDKFLKKTTIVAGIDSKIIKDAITGSYTNYSFNSDGESSFTNNSSISEMETTNVELSEEYLRDMEDKLSRFETLRDNMYYCERVVSKEAKKMTCDCFLTQDEIERGELGCGEDCLNRMLMIECGSRCVVGDRCTNKRFQKFEYANCQVFRTEKKGFGIQASSTIHPGEFIMEYVGEVLNSEQFDKRADEYSKEKNKHYYFMALRSDAIIDATTKGNISRFINHSCDPNAETQKWTVNGELRIGFFSTRTIQPGEEVTFDYQFQRYGKEAQKCYCEAENCRGWIGEEPDSEEEEYSDDEDEEEEEEEEEEVVEEIVVPKIPEEVAEKTADEIKPVEVGEEKPTTEAEAISTTETEVVKVKVIKVKKKKERLARKKRRNEIHDDPDLDVEIESLCKTGLRNQMQTLKLSRLFVRAKDLVLRSRLLNILRNGEMPCRRLFLDYHGLRLLYAWICELTDSEEDVNFRIEILETLERLPIPNKTMLKDSKILHTLEKWAQLETEDSVTNSPNDTNDEVMKNMPDILKATDIGVDKLKEIINSCENNSEKQETKENEVIKISNPKIAELATTLLESFVDLKEVFRIPKRERIEQMKEHEREADLRFKSLGLADEEPKKPSERFQERQKLKRSFDERDLDAKETYLKSKRISQISGLSKRALENMSKHQRRQLFEMQVAQEAAERRKKEMWLIHESNCIKFGLNPHMTPPCDVPVRMNPLTCQYFSADNRLLPTPPNHIFFNIQPPPLSTNLADYILPELDLPANWKCAIDEKGRLYYYHLKHRIPQWEPPVKKDEERKSEKIALDKVALENPILTSDSETTETCDSSEEEWMETLKELTKRDLKRKTSFNLDEVLAKPSDMTDELTKTIEKLESEESSPQQADGQEEPEKEAVNMDEVLEAFNPRKRKKYGIRLVQQKFIKPRTEEDKLYGQMEMKRYKETKEKLRRRKEEAKRMRMRFTDDADKPEASDSTKDADTSLLGEDDLVSQKLVEKNCIVDELDIISKKKASPYEEWKKIEQKLKKKASGKTSPVRSVKRKRAGPETNSQIDWNSDEARSIKDKFRNDIAGVIVQHLSAYRKDTCLIGKITNTEDFKHLARKLTHFVMLKELKHCHNSLNSLEVNESVKVKAREFIKKYMAKYGSTYVRADNEPDF